MQGFFGLYPACSTVSTAKRKNYIPIEFPMFSAKLPMLLKALPTALILLVFLLSCGLETDIAIAEPKTRPRPTAPANFMLLFIMLISALSAEAPFFKCT